MPRVQPVSVLPDRDAVDENKGYAGRWFPWCGVVGMVDKAGWREHADVGGLAGCEPTALVQPVDVGGAGGEVAHQPLVVSLAGSVDIVRGEAAKRAVGARVRMLTLVDAVRPRAVPLIRGAESLGM